MVELTGDRLRFSFPDVHPDARLDVTFQRTLRIPDDDKNYPLPPGLGAFPLRHVDDCGERVPADWSRHGGVLLPMYQSEALWIGFDARHVPGRSAGYPFLVRVAAGKIDAVTGAPWNNGVERGPQNYMVVPGQPWLDGFCVERGTIRQFVAMPLGGGYTAEEQLTGVAEHGGLQLLVHPMKREVFERRFPERHFELLMARRVAPGAVAMDACASADMGLAPGGRMTQDIYKDRFAFDDWDRTTRSRCFVHLANSLVWEAITGAPPPTPPPTARSYSEHGLPWFDYYADGRDAVDGSETLRRLRSVLEHAARKGEPALPENQSVEVDRVIRLGDAKRPGGGVREGAF